jgi:hypothetical protein
VNDVSAVYTERNRLVVLLAHLALSKGWKAGRYWDAFAEVCWENVVAIDLPTGQVSWHIGLEDCGPCGFASLPKYEGSWDGHTTDEKWERVYQLVQTFGLYGGYTRGYTP